VTLDVDATDDPCHGQQEGKPSMRIMTNPVTSRCIYRWPMKVGINGS